MTHRLHNAAVIFISVILSLLLVNGGFYLLGITEQALILTVSVILSASLSNHFTWRLMKSTTGDQD